MMRFRAVLYVLLIMFLALAAGCGRDLQAPATPTPAADKDGTETLGPPSIEVAGGARFAEGGVGMVGVSEAELTVEVPEGAQIAQVLLYWAGGTIEAAGDDEISLDGTLIQGQLIGGPTLFFGDYRFSAYRADITGLELVGPGVTTLTVGDFDFTGSAEDENDGASVVVIYDDGSARESTVRDGLDMAFFGFSETLNATAPQVFAVTPDDEPRTADLLINAGSVGENRPNKIRVTTSAGAQYFDNPLGSYDGIQWDSTVLSVDVPAGVDELEVELISTVSYDPLGASLGWVVAGLSVPEPAPDPTEHITGVVYVDADRDGVRDEFEAGVPGVYVTLSDGQNPPLLAVSDADGVYAFAAPAGAYTVSIDLSTDPDAFNVDLAQSFDPTTPVSLPVTVPPAATGLDFGFVPRIAQIIQDFADGELTSDAITGRDWRKIFRHALIEEASNRQGHGHGGVHNVDNGWGHDENYFNAEELYAILAQVQTLYLPWPYQFTAGDELREAYDLLSSHPRDPEGQLLRELFITELNYVVGRGIVGETDRTGVLISRGEALLNFTDEAKAGPADKGRTDDIIGAVVIFEAINTGGGGSVDE